MLLKAGQTGNVLADVLGSMKLRMDTYLQFHRRNSESLGALNVQGHLRSQIGQDIPQLF